MVVGCYELFEYEPYTPPNIPSPKQASFLGYQPLTQWHHLPSSLPYKEKQAAKKLRARKSNVSEPGLYDTLFSPTPFRTPTPLLDL
jgi:hypothetical protein